MPADPSPPPEPLAERLAEGLGASKVRRYDSHAAAVSSEMSRRASPKPVEGELDAEPCSMCGQPYHRYCLDDPEHEWSPVACINSLRAALDEVTAERDHLRATLATRDRELEALREVANAVRSALARSFAADFPELAEDDDPFQSGLYYGGKLVEQPLTFNRDECRAIVNAFFKSDAE